MRNDWHLFQTLDPIRLAVGQLNSLIEDSAVVAGSEAYAAARTVYTLTKISAGVAAGPGTGELAQRFTRKSRAAAGTTWPPAAQTESKE
jgi:hypothetical protein